MKATSSSSSIAAGRSNSLSRNDPLPPQMSTDEQRLLGLDAPEVKFSGVAPATCQLRSSICDLPSAICYSPFAILILFVRGGTALGLPLPGHRLAATYASRPAAPLRC